MDNVIVDIETNRSNWYAKEFGATVSKESMIGVHEDAGFFGSDSGQEPVE